MQNAEGYQGEVALWKKTLLFIWVTLPLDKHYSKQKELRLGHIQDDPLLPVSTGCDPEHLYSRIQPHTLVMTFLAALKDRDCILRSLVPRTKPCSAI